MTDTTEQTTPEATDEPTTDEQTPDTPEDTPEPDETPQSELETFPRAYVEELRQEAADNRVKAKRADDLAERLHTELVRATGRLADPSDLAFDEAHLDDAEALTAAVDELLASKPHLASRKPSGDVGQGHSGGDSVDLAGLLRARAS